VGDQLATWGFIALPADLWEPPQVEGEQALLDSYKALVQDTHMADGGTYRYRRYSRLLWQEGRLRPLSGHSIYQELKDNPLNGGVQRTFAPLQAALLDNPYLQAVVLKDAGHLGLTGDWQVGIHCVRILARPARPGLPTPEGIHRDAERYTVQHLLERKQVRGGVFTAYNESKQPVFHWLQLQRWDTLYFTGSLWHSASPVESEQGGHRDILLIDFEPL
jgi:hypothetical protein